MVSTSLKVGITLLIMFIASNIFFMLSFYARKGSFEYSPSSMEINIPQSISNSLSYARDYASSSSGIAAQLDGKRSSNLHQSIDALNIEDDLAVEEDQDNDDDKIHEISGKNEAHSNDESASFVNSEMYTECEIESFRMFYKKRFERLTNLKQRVDAAWTHPEPFFVHPDGRQVDAALMITNKRFDSWKNLLQTNAGHCETLKDFRSYTATKGYCTWCPDMPSFASISKNKRNNSACLNGTVTIFGSREEKGLSIRPTEASYINERLDILDLNKPSLYRVGTRSMHFQCSLSGNGEIPYNVEGSVIFVIDPNAEPIKASARRYQAYEHDPDIENLEAFNYKPEFKSGNPLVKVDFKRLLRENLVNRKGAYKNKNIAHSHVLCSRGMWGNVDGDFLAKVARYYAYQGFHKTVIYDTGMVTVYNHRSLEKAIREGIIIWVDMRPWLHDAYGYLQSDMLTMGKGFVQQFFRYDCLMRARSNGAKWVLFVDPDEFVFPGVDGWKPIESEKKTLEDQIRIKNLASYVDTAPNNITYVTFGSLPTRDDPVLCNSPLKWPSGDELVSQVVKHHRETEAINPSKAFHWNPAFCKTHERCPHGAGMRKYALRPSLATYVSNLEIHNCDCTSVFPWNVPPASDSTYPDILRVYDKSGYATHTNNFYMRHLYCTKIFGKSDNQRNPIKNWFK